MVPYDKVRLPSRRFSIVFVGPADLFLPLQPKEALQMLNTFLSKGGAAL